MLGNSIQLCGDLPEILIQIQGACTNQVAAQVEQAIRGDGFLRFCVDQQPGNISGMGGVLIFDVGVDLIEVGRMQGLFVETLLQCPIQTAFGESKWHDYNTKGDAF